MARPRERSRHRGMERQKEHEMQNLQTLHRSPTAEGSTAHIEDLYDDCNHGHPQSSGAKRLDRRSLRMCIERLAGVLRTCKERLTEVLWMCKEGLAKYRMTTILTATVICVFFAYGLWAFCGLNPSSEPSDNGLDQYTSTVYLTSPGPTTYITRTVHSKQFYEARPVHDQAPMVVPSKIEANGPVTHRDLSHPNVETVTSAPVSRLYFIPMSFTKGGWPRLQQDYHSSSRSASRIEGPQTLQGSPSSLNSTSEAKCLLRSNEAGAPRNLVAGQADGDTTSFTHWVVNVLYDLRRRSSGSIPSNQSWCIQNACSPKKQLNYMCNTNKTISDPFQKQECEWCWPEDQRKHEEITKHCTEVSKRAAFAMVIICGILFFCTLVIAILLASRMLRHRRRARADRVPVGLTHLYKSFFTSLRKHSSIGPENPAPSRFRLQKHRTKPLEQEMAIGDGMHERVPVLPPAPPSISSRVFSDIENMGQGRLLSDPGTSSSHHEPQGMPRQSSRQSRAVSSASEQCSSGASHRRDAGVRLSKLQRLPECS